MPLSKTDTKKLLKLLSDCSEIIRKRGITTREVDKSRQLRLMIKKIENGAQQKT